MTDVFGKMRSSISTNCDSKVIQDLFFPQEEDLSEVEEEPAHAWRNQIWEDQWVVDLVDDDPLDGVTSTFSRLSVPGATRKRGGM